MPSNASLNSIDNNDIMEEQKKRDRDLRETRRKSKAKYEKIKTIELCKIKLAKYLINDLKNYGPANLIHMDAISNVIGRPIQIWKSRGRFYRTINGTKEDSIQRPVDVEYHDQSPNHIGHFTLLGNKDPINIEINLNSCLFTVIAAQIGKTTNDLRTETIDFLTANSKDLIKNIESFISPNKNETSLMIGGARYDGTSPSDAAIIIDNSQNELCHGCRDYGHPRGHASDKDATGPKDSVENYSRTSQSMKSGFLNQSDQNHVAHIALRHTKAKRAMQNLNSGSTSESITFSRRDLESHSYDLPKMKEYYDGREYSDELDIIRVTLVLRHHQNEYNDANADVFVHTFYPRCN